MLHELLAQAWERFVLDVSTLLEKRACLQSSEDHQTMFDPSFAWVQGANAECPALSKGCAVLHLEVERGPFQPMTWSWSQLVSKSICSSFGKCGHQGFVVTWWWTDGSAHQPAVAVLSHR
jgi:hypothetical protein